MGLVWLFPCSLVVGLGVETLHQNLKKGGFSVLKCKLHSRFTLQASGSGVGSSVASRSFFEKRDPNIAP